jgi:hypothetical protein
MCIRSKNTGLLTSKIELARKVLMWHVSARSQMRPTKRLTTLVSKLSTVRVIDELSLHPAYARSRPNMGQGDAPAVCSSLL